MPVVKSRNEWEVVSQKSNQGKGALIRVEISPGRFVKKYAADIAAETKAKPKGKPAGQNKQAAPDENKQAAPDGNKQAAPDESGAPEADNFKKIKGVGIGAARALVAHEITTFEQLKTAGELDYLTPKVNKALETWRELDG